MNQQPNNYEMGQQGAERQPDALRPEQRPGPLGQPAAGEQPTELAPNQAQPIYDDLVAATRLERMTAEHGEAFTIWAELVGPAVATSEQAEKDFLFALVGHFDSKEEYVNDLLEVLDVPKAIEEAVDGIIGEFVVVDRAGLADCLESIGHVSFVAATGGGWWVFQW